MMFKGVVSVQMKTTYIDSSLLYSFYVNYLFRVISKILSQCQP